MLSRVLYVAAAVALGASILYALLVQPRPCGMDDVLSSCGSGVRTGALVGGLLIALLLAYVARAVSSKPRER